MSKRSIQPQKPKNAVAGRASAFSWRGTLLVLVLLAVPFFLYQKTGRFDFVNWDDSLHVYENPFIRSWDSANISSWFKKPFVSLYIPIPMASFAADYHFYGNNPAGFHHTNLTIHLLNVLLVFFLFRFFFKNDTVSFLGALLFAVHPVQTETVCWISARKTLLCGLFSLLTFLWFVKKDRSKFFWPVLGLLYAAALLSKITAVVLIPVFFLYSYFYGGFKIQKKYLWLLLIPAFAVLALTLPLYSKFFKNYHLTELGFYPLLRAGIYLKNFLFPAGLRLFYPLEHYPSVNAFALCALSAGFLLAAAAGFARKKIYSFWLLWMWLWLLPVLTLFAVPVADHHFYLPLIGMVGALLCLASHSKKILYGVLIAANLACLPLAARQIPVWENSETLWKHYLSFDNSDYRSLMQLADFYYTHGKKEDAAAIYEKLTVTWPKLTNAYMNLANLYLAAGDFQKAEETAMRLERNIPQSAYSFLIRALSAQAFKKSPDEAEVFFKKARDLAPGDSLIYNNLGRFYLQQRRWADANIYFRKAAEISSSAESYYYLGLIQNAGKEWRAALNYFKKMHSENIYFPGTYFQEGYANLKLNRRTEAEKFYMKSIQTDPDYSEAYLHLGLMYYQDDRLKEALPLLQAALSKKPGDEQAKAVIENINQRLKNV